MLYTIEMKRTYTTKIQVEAESQKEAIASVDMNEMYEKELSQMDTDEMTMEVTESFARICSATNEGMNEGFCFGDGDRYFKNEEDALKYAIEIGYESLEEAYDDEAYYFTDWEQDGE